MVCVVDSNSVGSLDGTIGSIEINLIVWRVIEGLAVLLYYKRRLEKMKKGNKS